MTSPKHIVLIGAGHTHLGILQRWKQRPIPNAELTLVSQFDVATYSGMIPGVIAGRYELSEAQVQLPALCEAAGVELIVEPAVGLNSEVRFVELASGRRLMFDVASIGIGSVPTPVERVDSPRIVDVKPIATLVERVDAAIEVAQQANAKIETHQPLSVTIVGGGAAGLELAFCLQRRLDNLQIGAAILIVEAGDKVLPGYRKKTRDLANRELIQRGILTRLGDRVVGMSEYRHPDLTGIEVEYASGDKLVPHIVIWAVGASAPPVLDGFDLPKTDDGFIAVKPTLQSVTAVPVFAVGDTASFEKQPVPKAGVYAVREVPVLWKNLQRLLAGLPLVSYNPQRGFLSLMNTGDGRAILEYRFCSLHNRWAWWLKDRIDRRFVSRHGS